MHSFPRSLVLSLSLSRSHVHTFSHQEKLKRLEDRIEKLESMIEKRQDEILAKLNLLLQQAGKEAVQDKEVFLSVQNC
jgi:restriction endonuclease S subunit